LHGNLAIQFIDQLLDNRQAQTCTAKMQGRRCARLREGLEHLAHEVSIHTNAIIAKL